jgi:hypothetical protein
MGILPITPMSLLISRKNMGDNFLMLIIQTEPECSIGLKSWKNGLYYGT